MKIGFLCFVLVSMFLAASALADQPVQFADITEKAGISFIHHNGAAGKKLLPEAMGSGCAFTDLDGDGWGRHSAAQ